MAPLELHVNVGLVLTPVAPLAGDGEVGVPGAEPPPAAVTATESNVDVFSCDVLWLVTMRPTLALEPRVALALPTVVHVTPSLETDPVTVDPDRHGQGVGTAMLTALTRHLRQRGVGRIDTACHRENVAAWRFYLRHGFRPLDEERIALLIDESSASQGPTT